MSQAKQLTDDVHSRARNLDEGELSLLSNRRVTVLACIDTRLSLYRLLDLDKDDAHVIRNPDGVVSEEAIRWLAIAQNLLGTEEIVLICDTHRGLADPAEDIREGIERVKASSAISHRDDVRGFVYDAGTGELHEVAQQSGCYASTPP